MSEMPGWRAAVAAVRITAVFLQDSNCHDSELPKKKNVIISGKSEIDSDTIRL